MSQVFLQIRYTRPGSTAPVRPEEPFFRLLHTFGIPSSNMPLRLP